MRKKTTYQVSGVLDTEPVNLPEGLRVQEVQVDLPLATLSLKNASGDTHTFLESMTTEKALAIVGLGLFREDEVRNLRDFCNLVLGEGIDRVVVDRHDDLWFELVPGLFTLGCDVSVDLNVAKARAEERRGESSSYVDKNLAWVEENYGPVKNHKE